MILYGRGRGKHDAHQSLTSCIIYSDRTIPHAIVCTVYFFELKVDKVLPMAADIDCCATKEWILFKMCRNL